MPAQLMGLRPLFLWGCILLSLPGLAAAGWSAFQAWMAWQAAETASRATLAAGDIMHASTALMVERGRVLDAVVAGEPDSEVLGRAFAKSDDLLLQAETALQGAGLPTVSVRQARSNIPDIRNKIAVAIRKQGKIRGLLEQYNRLVENIEQDILEAEHRITLANPLVGIVIGSARTANEVRGVAGRRGIVLNVWFSGQALATAQRDELMMLSGRLSDALARLQLGVRTSGLGSEMVERITALSNAFLMDKEPFYRELVRAAISGATPPLAYTQYRVWTVAALESLLPLREAMLSEARTASSAAINAARNTMFVAAGAALVSLVLAGTAVVILLNNLVEPARAMTTTMTALAAGNLSSAASARSGLQEINAMEAAVAVFRDNMASLRQREAELERTNVQFAAALENMAQGLEMYDADQRLAVFNRRCCAVVGVPFDRMNVGMSYRDVIALRVKAGLFQGKTIDQAHAEQLSRIHSHDLNVHTLVLPGHRQIASRFTPLADGGWVATYEDITERCEAEARIAHMAHHDALTGLPNRAMFQDRLEQALSWVRRGEHVALLCLDLDGFKRVNDTLGHPIGDKLLQAVAQRLLENTREVDLVARLGGDEFAIIQSLTQEPLDARLLADRLVEALRAPFELQGHKVSVGTSIGVMLADGSSTSDELLRNVDIALYRAKAEGRGVWRFFESSMDEDLQRRRTFEDDLRVAVARGEFEIHYQPLVHARTQEVTGFEALVRWCHPERGLISPLEFIPVAEEIGLIKAIGAWVLTQACLDAADWPAHMKVAVNLSPIQFQDAQLLDDVLQALASSRLSASRLELEITESVLLQDSDTTTDLLHRLHQLGTCISMDDFGTGYSSLSYLRRFPFDKIKIDQSFVRSIDSGTGSVEIIRAMVGLGKALNMAVLAEGVETAKQLAILRSEGCDELQGYFFSAPLPVQDLKAFIAKQSTLTRLENHRNGTVNLGAGWLATCG